MDENKLPAGEIRHIDITAFDARPLVAAYGGMAFQARALARAAAIYDRMLGDPECGVILTLAGPLCGAGLKDAVAEAVASNMVDVIVATGANIVDQDFFEALGFRHRQGAPDTADEAADRVAIDRIHDTYVDGNRLRECSDAVIEIAGTLEARPHSSREFISAMGAWLDERGVDAEKSIVHAAWQHNVPVFCPAFCDCEAGFGLLRHQWHECSHVTIDSVADLYEFTQVKLANPETGLLVVGGRVPENFARDVVVATDVLGQDALTHRYAVRIAGENGRNGARSDSSLHEPGSRRYLDVACEQTVLGEATTLLPLLLSDAWHRGTWRERDRRGLAELF